MKQQIFKNTQSEFDCCPRSVRVSQNKWQEIISTAAGILPFVVFYLIVHSGCQEDQSTVPQPKSSSISIKKQRFERWRKAAEQGNADAQVFLGVMYYKGMGVKQDQEQGIKLIRKVAKQGHDGAKQTLKDWDVPF